MERPIGMFDSGFGGLTVARALIDLLPAEDLVYIGDTGRYPYGSKPLDEVHDYAMQLSRSLVDDFDVKAIVVACNTASGRSTISRSSITFYGQRFPDQRVHPFGHRRPPSTTETPQIVFKTRTELGNQPGGGADERTGRIV